MRTFQERERIKGIETHIRIFAAGLTVTLSTLISPYTINLQAPQFLATTQYNAVLEEELKIVSFHRLEPLELPLALQERADIEEMIARKALEQGVSVELALFIVSKESRFDNFAVGDEHLTCERTGKPIRSRGLWQFADCYHPDITDEMAFDPEVSTDLALPKLKTNPEMWSTYRLYQ